MSDLVSLVLDGTTAIGGALVWDGLGTLGGTATPSSVSGEDTGMATFTFAPGGFTMGDTFTLSTVDPDFFGAPSSGVEIGEMIGVSVYATFADASKFSGSFVDYPAINAGLELVADISAVPVPAGGLLPPTGLGALGFSRRRKAQS